MFFNEQGMLNLDEAVMNQPTFKKIMEDGIVTEQEIKEQSERMVSILKSMEKNYTEEQQREIKELLVEAGVLFTTSQYHIGNAIIRSVVSFRQYCRLLLHIGSDLH